MGIEHFPLGDYRGEALKARGRRERDSERESFIRNNLHNGVVSGAALRLYNIHVGSNKTKQHTHTHRVTGWVR